MSVYLRIEWPVLPKHAVGLNIVQKNIHSGNTNTLNQVKSRIFPYSQFADDNGNPLAIEYGLRQSYIQSTPAKGFLDWSYIPLNELATTDNSNKTINTRLSTGLKYIITKGLSAEAKYQYENTISQNRIYQSQETYYTRNLINTLSIITADKVTGYNLPLGGILNLNNGNTISNNARGTLNYNYSWNNNTITALTGYEISQTLGENNQSVLYGYNDNLATFTAINPTTIFSANPTGRAIIPSGLGITSTLIRLRSSFANASYGYNDRYTLSVSARVDGTNYFGVATNNKKVPLWSAGAKWDIARERFYKLSWMPKLALRVTYGYNGNLIQSVTGVTTFSYLNGAPYTNLSYARVSNIGNPDLRWEKIRITNLAIDFGTKNNAINGNFEYYLKKETDLLGFKAFPENSGIANLQGNYSDMIGHGFDLSVTTHNLNRSLKWHTTLLFSHAINKVTRYDISPLSSQLTGSSGILTGPTPNVGKPVYGIYGYKWGGLDPINGNPIGFVNAQPSQDYATLTTKTPITELVYLGSARPTYFGGLNNRLTYKGISLNIQIIYNLGYYFMAPSISYTGITANTAFLKVNKDYKNRWQYPGDEKHTNVPSFIYPTILARDQFHQYSEVNMLNAGYVRLQDLSLSYELNRSVCRKLPLANLQLALYTNNVGILWRANNKGFDPEAIPGLGDNSTMPNPQSISIGLKGTF